MSTPPMATPPTVEKITTTPGGAGDAPSPGDVGKGKSKGLGGVKLDKKTAMIGGAVVVGLIALLSSRGGSETDTEPLEVAELDTSGTDIYNDLQPELEKLTDAIEGFRDGPAPAKPAPVGKTPAKPTRPKPAPKPKQKPAPKPKGKKKQTGRRYRVQSGDNLSKIAARFKVKGGHARLYRANRAAIELAARKHGRKGSVAGRYIYPGTVLVIP